MRKLLSLFLLYIALASAALTTVTSTLYDAQANLARGYLIIDWPQFTAADTSIVAPGEIRVDLASGVMTVQLTPITNATCVANVNCAYHVRYFIQSPTGGTVQRRDEFWAVGITTPVSITDVQTAFVTVPTAQVRLSQLEADGASGTNMYGMLYSASLGRWHAYSLLPLATANGGLGQAVTPTSGRYLRGTGSLFDISSVPAGGAGACASNQWIIETVDDAAPICAQPTAAQVTSAFDRSTNNDIGAFYFDVGKISAPSNPGANKFRVFVNTATGLLACLDSSGANCMPGGTPSGAAGGDLSGTYPNPTVAKVNAVAYPAAPATDTTPVITASNTATYKSLPDCDDTAGQHLNYDTATHGFSCGTSGGGTGGNNNALFTATADAGPNNTATETSVIGTGVGSKTTAANYFAAGTSLRVESSGYLSTPVTPDTLNVKIKAGSTIVGQTGAQTYTGLLSNQVFRVIALITCRTAGVSGTFIVNTIFESTSTALGVAEAKIVNTSTVTLDTTGTLAWDVTATWGAAQSGELIIGTNFVMFTPGTGLVDPAANGLIERTALNTTAAISPTDDTIPIGNGTTHEAKTIPNCTDTGGNHLNYTQSTNTLSCGTTGGGAPTTVPYVTTAPDGTLSAEVVLGKLAEYQPEFTTPASANAMDDEFIGSISGTWTRVVSSSSTWTDNTNTPGTGWLQTVPTNASKTWTLSQAIPAGDWEFQTRCGTSYGTVAVFGGCGMVLLETQANTSKHYFLSNDSNNSNGDFRVFAQYDTSFDVFSASKGTAQSGGWSIGSLTYFKIKRVSTTYSFYASTNGITWRTIFSSTIGEFTPGFIGVFAFTGASVTDVSMTFDWFRRIS